MLQHINFTVANATGKTNYQLLFSPRGVTEDPAPRVTVDQIARGATAFVIFGSDELEPQDPFLVPAGSLAEDPALRLWGVQIAGKYRLASWGPVNRNRRVLCERPCGDGLNLN